MEGRLNMKYESKIIGINPLWITTLLTVTFLIVCATGGKNVDWGYLGFEVIFPFYMAIVIGEWCKTRTDPMFDPISAQGNSLFLWILRRFVLLFGLVLAFSIVGMVGVSIIAHGVTVGDLIIAFIPTTYFLSSVSIFLSLVSSAQHIPALAVGVIWLFSIMSMSLLRFHVIQYFYLFASFAGINSSVWIINKFILLFIGIILWLGVFFICKKRLFTK